LFRCATGTFSRRNKGRFPEPAFGAGLDDKPAALVHASAASMPRRRFFTPKRDFAGKYHELKRQLEPQMNTVRPKKNFYRGMKSHAEGDACFLFTIRNIRVYLPVPASWQQGMLING
jgi:hypothetical protein